MAVKNLDAIIHDPATIASSWLQFVEHNKDLPGITWGIKELDDVILPLRPGELVVLMGRPGHGKTSLALWLALRVAREIKAEQEEKDERDNRVACICSWEQTVEELETIIQSRGELTTSDLIWGNVDADAIRRRVVDRARLPLWIIGYSMLHAGEEMPRMTPDIIFSAIEEMERKYDTHPKPALVVFDYLQLIPVPSARDRVREVTEATLRAKELALRIGAPIILCVQASREADKRNPPIPALGDCQWSSGVEQAADLVLACVRPFQISGLQTIKLDDGREVEVNENVLILRILKQRFGIGYGTFALYFDPARLVLQSLTAQTI